MDLLLWRHAHARDSEPGESDMDRPLTTKGVRQAEKMAGWLRTHMPSQALVLSSPALRTVQTAQSLHLPFNICEDIRPEGSVQAFIKASRWPHSPVPVLMVGHQPVLSQVVSELLGGSENSPLPFRKGALWWLRLRYREDLVKTQLMAVMDTEFL
jgi:phosphohistidine phosphatase